jgi:zinc protease
VVSVHIWLRVGSAFETPQESGIAHFLEHMLFKGAGSHGVGEAVTLVEALGGEINAWTSFESTVLHATVPAGRELDVIRLLGDMAFHPHLDPEELERERKVVLEEIRESKDSPGHILADRERALAWGEHPYGSPILGSADSVSQLSHAEMKEFHQQHYRPGNAIVVVAGPVDESAILEELSHSLVDPVGSVQPAVRSVESRVVSPGSFCIDGGFEDTSFEVAFRVPDLAHADIAPLDLLAAVLGGSRNSILSRILRHEMDCVVSSWAMLENDRDGGLFVAGVTPRKGRAAEAIEQLIRILNDLVEVPINESALRRARAGVLRDRLLDAETVDGRASRLAWYQACFDDPTGSEKYEAEIRRCRIEDLRRVAGSWLDLDQAVMGMVAPPDELDKDGLDAAVAAGRCRSQAPAVRTPVEPISCHTMDNGMVIRCEPDPAAQLVGITLMGFGGALAEGPRMPGLGRAWSSVLCRGAGDLDALQLAAEVEERAGRISASTGRSTLGLRLSFPVSELSSAMELLSLLLLHPRFEASEVERVRKDLVQRQQSIDDDPDYLAWLLTWSGLFPGHPWGRPRLGTAASAGRLSPGRIRAYHRRVIQGSNLVMAVSGAVDPEQVIQLTKRRLGKLVTGERHPLSPPVPRARFRSRPRRSIPREGAPACLSIGFPCPGDDQADGPTAEVLGAVLGGASGGAGRLFDELRERQGLAYSVGACAELGLGGGALICSMSTDPARLESARIGLWRELDRVVRDGVPADELERIKNSLVDGAVLGLQRTSSRANHLAAAELFGHSNKDYRKALERPRKVSAEDLSRLASQVLRRECSVEAIVAPC